MYWASRVSGSTREQSIHAPKTYGKDTHHDTSNADSIHSRREVFESFLIDEVYPLSYKKSTHDKQQDHRDQIKRLNFIHGHLGFSLTFKTYSSLYKWIHKK